MRKFGTFLISAVFIAGAALIGPNQGTYLADTVYATSTDAETENNSDKEETASSENSADNTASDNSSTENISTENTVTVTTTSTNKSNKKVAYYATPKLVVTGSEIKGGTVKAGDEFEMIIHLKNESNSTKLRNISLKLSSEENQIITASGSDSIYIDSMDKEEECDVSVKLKAKNDLAQKNYLLNIEYNYENNSKNTFDGTAAVTVPVIQEARLGISEVKLSKSELFIDGKTSLSFKVNNMGLDTLRNVSVEFSGDTIKEITYYAGTVEAGLSSSVDMTITPDQVGSEDINIKVTFEDASGNVGIYEDKIPLVVNEAKPEVAEADREIGVSPALIGSGVLGIIMLIVIIGNIVKKVRLKRYE